MNKQCCTWYPRQTHLFYLNCNSGDMHVSMYVAHCTTTANCLFSFSLLKKVLHHKTKHNRTEQNRNENKMFSLRTRKEEICQTVDPESLWLIFQKCFWPFSSYFLGYALASITEIDFTNIAIENTLTLRLGQMTWWKTFDWKFS